MNSEKLNEIGEKMNLSPNELKRIQKEYKRRKVYSLLTGCLMSIVSYLLGYLFGKRREARMEHHGYPYGMSSMNYCCIGVPVFLAGSGLLLFLSYLEVKNRYKLALSIMITFFFILTVLAFIFGYEAGQPVQYYSQAIDYGVYSRER